ncbi:MAG: dephospho-CoA kinase [Arcobacter butzleri]|nr:dephospho-CoA kinase [Arcobacteraceae bacterium]NLO17752.1 dephospho-CoA kinase [Aliarcobacter butzleri]
MQKDSLQYAIALTGGIGTGKSTVSNLFRLYGFLIIDADKIAKEILSQNSSFVSQTFGKEYILDNGQIDRKKLGSLVFSDESAKKRLEEFIHPLIKDEIYLQANLSEKSCQYYLIDIPLFFETKNYDIPYSIVIYASPEQQLKRVMQRDGLSDIEAQKRIKSQIDISKKKEMATFVIDNTKDLKHLQNEVDRVIRAIKSL